MRVFEVYFHKLAELGDIPAGRDVAAFAARNWIEAVHACRTAFGAENAGEVFVTYVWERTGDGYADFPAYDYLRGKAVP